MRNLTAEATNITRQNFDGANGWGNQGDAFRHTYWMARGVQSNGERFTRNYGNAHEYSSDPNEVYTQADIMMDIHNNDIGIEIGKQNPKASSSELVRIVKDRIANGDMLIMDSESGLLYKSNDTNYQNPIAPDDPFIRCSNVSEKIIDHVNN
jgi:hypothetical protein